MATAALDGKGLEGVTATSSAISSIIGTTLTYRGIDINELAENSTFEEVVYLLWFGELPTRAQLEKLQSDLVESRTVPRQVFDLMSRFPREANAMATLTAAAASLPLYSSLASDMSESANHRKAVELVAQFPVIVAAMARFREGKDPVAPDPNLSTGANLLYMMRGEKPDDREARVMDIALILHADHELNASTFAARVAASTLSDKHSAVVAALCTLKGPLHGGANEQVMKTLEQIGSVEGVSSYVREALDRKERIMGFGHRVYKEGDPRAKWLKKLSRELGEAAGNTKWYEMSSRMEEEVKADKGLLPNVDFYSASVYTYLGIPRDLFTPVFAVSRVSGWTAHILEQYADNRLIRPRAEYVGPEKRSYVPIQERA